MKITQENREHLEIAWRAVRAENDSVSFDEFCELLCRNLVIEQILDCLPEHI